jgi:hypothetical protein
VVIDGRSELTLFKDLFKPCEHEYRYFHCESIPRNSFVHSCQHQFSFICTKCEKVFTVTEDELVADYKAYQKEVNRRNIIGKPYDLEPTTLTFGAGLIQFNGVACTLLMNKYKFLNLKEIEPPQYSHCEGPISYAKGA